MYSNLKQRIHNAWQNLKTKDRLGLIVQRLEKHAKSHTTLRHEDYQKVLAIREAHRKQKERLEQTLNDQLHEINIKYADQELNIYDQAK